LFSTDEASKEHWKQEAETELDPRDLCRVEVTKGKGGLKATGSPLGESGEWNLRGTRNADRMPEPLVID